MSLILNKQYAGTQLYNNKFLNKKQSYKGDLTNNSNSQYSTNPVKNNLYSANLAFTSAAGVNAIRVLRDNKGQYICEVFEATKSRRDINKLLNNLGNLDDSTSKGIEKLEKTKKEIEELIKNREITKIPVDKLKKPFNKLLSSQPDKVRSGSRLVKWLIDLNILPQTPNMEAVCKNLLEDKETANPLMEVIGYLAEGNKLKKLPDDVVDFIKAKGKAKAGNSKETINIAKDTFDKLYKANLIEGIPSLENIQNTLKMLNAKSIPEDQLPKKLLELESWASDECIDINKKYNLISGDHVKLFFNFIDSDKEDLSSAALKVVDTLAYKRHNGLEQLLDDDISLLDHLFNKFDSKNSDMGNYSVQIIRKLLQNKMIKNLPEKYINKLMDQLTSEDPAKLKNTLLAVGKIVNNHINGNKKISFISDSQIQRILDLTSHNDDETAKASMNLTRTLIMNADRIDNPELIKNVPEVNIEGILENLNRNDTYVLNYSMSLLRIMIDKKIIKDSSSLITQDHINRILELTNDQSDHVSCSAIDTVNTFLKNDFENMKKSIDNETVGNLINKLNSNNPKIVLATTRLIKTLDDIGLLKKSSNQKAMFRNQFVNQADYVEITPDTLKNMRLMINSQDEKEKVYYQKIINILREYGFIS